MLSIIGLLVLVVLLVIVASAALQLKIFHIQRSIFIQTTPDKIFPHLNNFHAWGEWSPYEKLDPTMERSFSGPADGRGAVYTWEGTRKVGAGRMEILESSASSAIKIKLDFLRPWKAHNQSEFTLVPQQNGTKVTWAMTGPMPWMGRVMHFLINMDKMVGKDFETGLANLKAIAEKETNGGR